MADFHVTYSHGPRYIDGVNIDADANATTEVKKHERSIDEPVQGFLGRGYQPGQRNEDGGLL